MYQKTIKSLVRLSSGYPAHTQRHTHTHAHMPLSLTALWACLCSKHIKERVCCLVRALQLTKLKEQGEQQEAIEPMTKVCVSLHTCPYLRCPLLPWSYSAIPIVHLPVQSCQAYSSHVCVCVCVCMCVGSGGAHRRPGAPASPE